MMNLDAELLPQAGSTVLDANSDRLRALTPNIANNNNVILVNSLEDDVISDAQTSLREAIDIANSTPDHDVILLEQSGTYTIEIANENGNENNNETGDFDILGRMGGVTIVAAEQGTVIDAQGSDRIFDVKNNAKLTLQDIILTGGVAGRGGGIRNRGRVILDGTSSVQENVAKMGGGIFNRGIVKLNDSSSILTNLANHEGGGIYNHGTVKLSGDTLLQENSATEGGGVFNLGGLKLMDASSLVDNTAEAGGGIFNEGITRLIHGSYVEANIADVGGGIFNRGSLFLKENSLVTDNIADWGGGIINDQGLVKLMGDSKISENTAILQGGGLFNHGRLKLMGNSSIVGNTARIGGGLFNTQVATLNDASEILGNTATYAGGAYNIGILQLKDSSGIIGNEAVIGGGVMNDDLIQLKDQSLIAGNLSDIAAGGLLNILGGSGGNIDLTNQVANNSPLDVGNFFEDYPDLPDELLFPIPRAEDLIPGFIDPIPFVGGDPSPQPSINQINVAVIDVSIAVIDGLQIPLLDLDDLVIDLEDLISPPIEQPSACDVYLETFGEPEVVIINGNAEIIYNPTLASQCACLVYGAARRDGFNHYQATILGHMAGDDVRDGGNLPEECHALDILRGYGRGRG